MNIRFRTLCEIEVVHGYYTDMAPCRDIEFDVPVATPVLAAGKLLIRQRHGRLTVLYEEVSPPRKIAGQTLFIGLRPVNPYFANFTQPPVAPGALPVYANRTQADRVDPPLAAGLLASHQRIAAALTARPLSLRWQLGTQVIVEELMAAGQDAVDFVTRDWPAGHYTLTQQAGAASVVSHWLLHPELAGLHPWGVLALTIDSSFYDKSPLLSIRIEARRERLKYYVVARKFGDSEFTGLNVFDAAASSPEKAIVFDKIASEHFSEDDYLPAQLPGEPKVQVVLFQSHDELERRAGGYRKLQLRRTEEVLIQHLPQAGPDRAQARFVVHLAKS